MKAIVLEHIGGVEGFKEKDLALSLVDPDSVCIRIHAVAFNPLDAKIRLGQLGLKPPLVLGADCSGVIVETGAHVNDLRVGDRVAAIVFGNGEKGAYSEYVVVPRAWVFKIPESLSFEEAATLPVISLTAYRATHVCHKISSDNSIFVAGGTGSVGRMALQMLQKIGVKKIMTTAGSEEGRDSLINSLGIPSDSIFVYKNVPLESAARLIIEKNEGNPFSVVIDFAGGYFKQLGIALLDVHGHMISIVTEPPNVSGEIMSRGSFFQKSLTLHMISIRSEATFKGAKSLEIYRKEFGTIQKMVELGQLKPCNPIVLGNLNVKTVQQAHKLLEEGNAKGKLVMRVTTSF